MRGPDHRGPTQTQGYIVVSATQSPVKAAFRTITPYRAPFLPERQRILDEHCSEETPS
jgi:hypothetical protein